MSSGAAVAGSPLSGGTAGAKSTIRFITDYAADESERAGLGIRFIAAAEADTGDRLGSGAVVAARAPASTSTSTSRASARACRRGRRQGHGRPGELGYAPSAYLPTPAGLTRRMGAALYAGP